MLTSVDVLKVLIYSASLSESLGLFRSANIPQIADVVRRLAMVLDKSSPWNEYKVPPLLTSTTTQTRTQVFWVNGSIISNFAAVLTSSMREQLFKSKD